MEASRFADRAEAGGVLARMLSHYANQPGLLVLALPRGGVPVAYEVARELNAPLDAFVVRKLGVPGHEELAMGAVATGGVRVLNDEVVRAANIPEATIEAVTQRERRILEEREHSYRGSRPAPLVEGRTVILVDDGLATGSTMRAAVLALRDQRPKSLTVAVPVSARETCDEFGPHVDEIICAMTPEPFYAVGMWYEDFSETTDDQVRDLLQRAVGRHQASAEESTAVRSQR